MARTLSLPLVQPTRTLNVVANEADDLSVTVPAQSWPAPPPNQTPQVPTPPTGLAGAYDTGTGKVKLTWAAVAGITYVVYRTTDINVARWPVIGSKIIGGAFADPVPQGAAVQTLYYTVTSVAADGSESVGANFITVKIPAVVAPTKLPAPASFSAAFVASKNVVHMTWAAVAGATKGYALHMSADMSDPESHPPIATLPPGTVSYDYPVVPTNASQMLMFCPAGIDASGVIGNCAADQMVTVPPITVTPPSTGNVTVLAQYPNVNSIVFKVKNDKGAKDCWIRDLSNPNNIKAAGGEQWPGEFIVEWNGTTSGPLVIELLDDLAPFMNSNMATMNGMTGPNIKNGHGLGTNPKVIASSTGITPKYQPRDFAGDQAFLDSFQNTVVVQKTDKLTNLSFSTQDGNWKGTAFNANNRDSIFFAMGNHIMNDLYDGGTPGTSLPPKNQNATATFEMQRDFNMKGGILHVTMEVDAYFPIDARRKIQMFLMNGGDVILNPENIEVINNGGTDFSRIKPTTSGKCIVVETAGEFNSAYCVDWNNGVKSTAPITKVGWGDGAADRFGSCRRGHTGDSGSYEYLPGKVLNHTDHHLDLRHRFDYIFAAPEVAGAGPNGSVTLIESDAEGYAVLAFSKPLPINFYTLFPTGVVRPAWSHKVYHTANEPGELNANIDYYVLKVTPDFDRRHWNNMGARRLTRMPFVSGGKITF